MTRFFFPIILVLLISWLVVGLQQEKKKIIDKKLIDESTEVLSINFFDSLLKLPHYESYIQIRKGALTFLLPNTYYERYDLTYETDAIMQFSSLNYGVYGVIYKDNIVNDSTAFNFSKETYCSSTLKAARKYSNVIVIDSSIVDVFPDKKGIKTFYIKEKMTEDGSIDSVVVTFISLENNKDLYMLYMYARPQEFRKYKAEIENIMSSIYLENE